MTIKKLLNMDKILKFKVEFKTIVEMKKSNF